MPHSVLIQEEVDLVVQPVETLFDLELVPLQVDKLLDYPAESESVHIDRAEDPAVYRRGEGDEAARDRPWFIYQRAITERPRHLQWT